MRHGHSERARLSYSSFRASAAPIVIPSERSPNRSFRASAAPTGHSERAQPQPVIPSERSESRNLHLQSPETSIDTALLSTHGPRGSLPAEPPASSPPRAVLRASNDWTPTAKSSRRRPCEQQVGGHGEQRGHGTAERSTASSLVLRALPTAFLESWMKRNGASRRTSSIGTIAMPRLATLARNDHGSSFVRNHRGAPLARAAAGAVLCASARLRASA